MTRMCGSGKIIVSHLVLSPSSLLVSTLLMMMTLGNCQLPNGTVLPYVQWSDAWWGYPVDPDLHKLDLKACRSFSLLRCLLSRDKFAMVPG
jgi:hypothetical protein